MSQTLGVLETTGLAATMAAVDAMEKAAQIRVLQCELNDYYGVVTKITGSVEDVRSAIEAGRLLAQRMGGRPVAIVIPRPNDEAWRAIQSPREHNPLIQQDVVFFPRYETIKTVPDNEGSPIMENGSIALGFIETQGFTAVFEAIDTACKAANVEVVGKEKLGGGYVTIIVRGNLSSVTSAIEAGKAKVDGLGTLIAAHVIARPSPSVLALLPK